MTKPEGGSPSPVMPQTSPLQPRWHESFATSIKSLGVAVVGSTKAITGSVVDSVSALVTALTGFISAVDAGRANFLIDVIAFSFWGGFIYLTYETMMKISPVEFLVSCGVGFFITLAFTGWCLNTCYLKNGLIKGRDSAP
ncbi:MULTISPECIES: hypothetical protein [Aeromonas]|uniref:hypothetical protein n=1 Tax=Aeromonas TaxID=642 RepID=UPI00132FE873|nr:hypothetical protein [Aeromonas salmonicida]